MDEMHLPRNYYAAQDCNSLTSAAGIHERAFNREHLEQPLAGNAPLYLSSATYTTDRMGPTLRCPFSCGAYFWTMGDYEKHVSGYTGQFYIPACGSNPDNAGGWPMSDATKHAPRSQLLKSWGHKAVGAVHQVLRKLHNPKRTTSSHAGQVTRFLLNKPREGRFSSPPAENEAYEMYSELSRPSTQLSELECCSPSFSEQRFAPGWNELPIFAQAPIEMPESTQYSATLLSPAELSEGNYSDGSSESSEGFIPRPGLQQITSEGALVSPVGQESVNSYSSGFASQICNNSHEREGRDSYLVAVSPIDASPQDDLSFSATVHTGLELIPPAIHDPNNCSDTGLGSSNPTSPTSSIPTPPSPSLASDIICSQNGDRAVCCACLSSHLLKITISAFLEYVPPIALNLIGMPAVTPQDIVSLGREASEHGTQSTILTNPGSLTIFIIYTYSAALLLDGIFVTEFATDMANHFLRLVAHLQDPFAIGILHSFATDLSSIAAMSPTKSSGLDPTVFFPGSALPEDLRRMYAAHYPHLASFPENHRSCFILNTGRFEYTGTRAFPSVLRRRAARYQPLENVNEGILDWICLRFNVLLSRPSTKCASHQIHQSALKNEFRTKYSNNALHNLANDLVLGPLNLGIHFECSKPVIARVRDAISRGQIRSFESLERQLVDSAMDPVVFPAPQLYFQFVTAAVELCDSAVLSLSSKVQETYHYGLQEQADRDHLLATDGEKPPSAFIIDIGVKGLVHHLHDPRNTTLSGSNNRRIRETRARKHQITHSTPSESTIMVSSVPISGGPTSKCGICGLKLGGNPRWHKGNMKRHMKTKHGHKTGKHLACDECQESYSRSDALQKHMKVEHPNLYQPQRKRVMG